MSFRELYDTGKRELMATLGDNIKDFRLEQVVPNKKDGGWNIVVSYLMKDPRKEEATGLMTTVAGLAPYERIYKELYIQEGKVQAMYIYNQAG